MMALFKQLAEMLRESTAAMKALQDATTSVDTSLRDVQSQLASLTESLARLRLNDGDRPTAGLVSESAPPPAALVAARPSEIGIVEEYRNLVEYVARTPGLREVESRIMAFLSQWAMVDAANRDLPPSYWQPADMRSTVWASHRAGAYLCFPGYPSFSDPGSIAAGGGYVGHQMLGAYFDITLERSEGRLMLSMIAPGRLSYEGGSWSVVAKGQISIRSQ